MTVDQYAAGVGSVVAVLFCATVVGVVARRLLAPGWRGALAALMSIVIAYSFLIVEGELLGTFGLFSRGPIVIASVVVAGAVALTGLLLGVGPGVVVVPVPSPDPALSDGPASVSESSSARPWWSFNSMSSLAASACAVLLLAQGLVALRATARTGNLFIDALEYHLTMAAHFATSHHTGGIIQLAPSSPVSYYPFNSELLHGMGIALFHRDSLSLLLTLADIAVALLAAWCVGSAFGVGPVALCAVSPMLALLGTFDASAINDWAAVWPLIALLAIAVHAHKDGALAARGVPLVAGLAGGLAMGAKLNLLAPTGVLLVGYLVMVSRGRRARSALLLVIGAAASSMYWYVRNLVDVGSPLPSEHIPGLTRVPMPALQQYGYSVAHYLHNTSVIRHFFRPGLEFFFGKAWIAVLLLAALGVVIGLLAGPGMPRMAAVVAVVATGAYLVTPTGAFGPDGHPYLFGDNLRYALPALALGLVVLAISKLARHWPGPVALVFLATLVVTLLGPRMWALGHGTTIAAIAVSVVAVLFVRLPFVRRHGAALVVVGVLVVAALGYPANHRYLHDRYHSTATAKQALYASLQDRTGQRIGVVGSPVTYPFLGATYTNSVSYVGETQAHHQFADYATCSAWRAAVAAGRYAYVVVEISSGNPPPPALAWTQSDPAATPVVQNDAGSVFAIGPGFAAQACPTA